MAAGMLSTDGGQHWKVATQTGGFPNSLKLAAASASIALASPAPETLTGALVRTTNGGNTYSVVIAGSEPSAATWMGFSDTSRAYAIVAGGLLESNNAGESWQSVAFKA